MLLKFEVETNEEYAVRDALDLLQYLCKEFPRYDDEYIVLKPEKPAPEPEEIAIPGLDVDSEGLPWDARIHSSSKAKNKDGSWKRMRGVSDDEFYKVAQEIRDTLSISNDINPIFRGESGVLDEPKQSNIDPSEIFKPADEQPTPTPTYLELVSILGQATKENRIDNTKIQEAVTGVGLAAFTQLAVRIDLIPAFITRLGL